MKRIALLIMLLAITIVTGCGSSDDDSAGLILTDFSAFDHEFETGTFRGVESMEYIVGDSTGMVQYNQFYYKLNEPIEFYVGSIFIGEVTLGTPDAVITLDDIISEEGEHPEKRNNTIRFLLTIDADPADAVFKDMIADVLENLTSGERTELVSKDVLQEYSL